jgi:hypothetical protein
MQASASGNESRRKVAHDCDMVTCDPRRFVNGIMMLPNSDPSSAKPKYEGRDRCLRVRSFPLSAGFSSHQPPEFEVAPLAQSRCKRKSRSEWNTAVPILDGMPGERHKASRGLTISVHWIAASAAPRIAFGFSVVPLCNRTAASSMFPPLSVCNGMLHELALPVQSPSFIQRRTTLW